jgi:hypothetical protein
VKNRKVDVKDMKIEIDVDPATMFSKPQQVIQEFSLILLSERIKLLERVKGMEWNNSTTKGRIVDCSNNAIVIELPSKERQELQLTGQRLRQLLAAATTR